MSPEEEQWLLSHCGPQLQPLVIAALHTWFRASELLSLTWEDVDCKCRVITVRAAYAKNGESHSVPMNAVLTETLRMVRMNASAVTGSMFCSRNGTPYRSFRTAFERAIRQAGIEGLVFHDLRHSFASRLVMSSVDLLTVQVLMGHKEISMTLRYTHLTTDHKQQAVRALETFGEKSQQFSQHRGWEGAQGSRNALKIHALS